MTALNRRRSAWAEPDGGPDPSCLLRRDTAGATAGETPPALDLESAARTLGVHYQTAYRWIRTGVLPAVKVGAEYRLSIEDVEALAELRRSPVAPCYSGRNRDWEGLVGQLYGAVVAGDETGARRAFDRMHLARVPMLEQCEQLVAPVARRLGQECSAGTLSPARVRLATGIFERQLARAAAALSEHGGPRALVVLPSGEQHRLPAIMAGAVLRAARWAVNEIGGSVGAADVVDFVREAAPALVVIPVTVAVEAGRELETAISRVAAVPVLVGGAGAPLAELAEGAWVASEAMGGSAGLRRRLPAAARQAE